MEADTPLKVYCVLALWRSSSEQPGPKLIAVLPMRAPGLLVFGKPGTGSAQGDIMFPFLSLTNAYNLQPWPADATITDT
jgi:hypothetical protein